MESFMAEDALVYGNRFSGGNLSLAFPMGKYEILIPPADHRGVPHVIGHSADVLIRHYNLLCGAGAYVSDPVHCRKQIHA